MLAGGCFNLFMWNDDVDNGGGFDDASDWYWCGM